MHENGINWRKDELVAPIYLAPIKVNYATSSSRNASRFNLPICYGRLNDNTGSTSCLLPVSGFATDKLQFRFVNY